jgi:hypothetical protein
LFFHFIGMFKISDKLIVRPVNAIVLLAGFSRRDLASRILAASAR